MFTLLLIAALIILNAYFSAAEIAIVSVKKYKIQKEADKGNKSAIRILGYIKNPNEYLSTIQFGLTLIGLFEGLYGGEALQKLLEPKLTSIGLSTATAHLVSIIMGVGFITYVTVIIGELLPKSLALREPQQLALRIMPSFYFFSFITLPFVKILTVSTRLLLKFINIGKTENQALTDDDLKSLLGIAYRQGTLEKEELKLHENIFSFYEQNVEFIMTKLQDVLAVNIDHSEQDADQIIRNNPHNYFPVINNQNKVIGYLCARDYFSDAKKSLQMRTKPACIIHKNQKASELLKNLKSTIRISELLLQKQTSLPAWLPCMISGNHSSAISLNLRPMN